MNPLRQSLRAFFRNKWTRFSLVGIPYLFWVIWLNNYWWLLGLGVLFDLYITKKVRWAFWRKKGVKKQSAVVEWVDAIIFALIAASFIRLFLFEAYTIPTSSMEKSMMVGDYLFVSKVSYGPKVPNTPLAFPLVHHTLPLTDHTPSFVEWIKNPYRRLAGLGQIQRGDVVVFNFPAGDTVVAQRQNENYHDLVRQYGKDYLYSNYDILVRPVDKRENYIKRCVAVAGDSLKVVRGKLWVNGKLSPWEPGMQYRYQIQTNGEFLSTHFLDEIKIPKADRGYDPETATWDMPLTLKDSTAIQKLGGRIFMKRYCNEDGENSWQSMYPGDSEFKWTEDYYGPIWIPKKGVSIALTPRNWKLYVRVIQDYEGNQVKYENGKAYINGQLRTSYTFKMNYYWMMGDNRHNSLDSRFWGFVPEDHVVGKASLIWLSLDPDKSFPFNIRWDRLFKSVH